MRTSISHPLQIAEVETGQPGHGLIGVTFCPGKYDPYGMSGAWNRDLALDLDAVRDWGAVAVVTLLESHEFELLRVERLGEEVSRRDMEWFHLPIVDTRIPDNDFEQKWEIAGEKLRSILRDGSDLVVHCRGGLGRAGTIAARLLIELGVEPEEAIERVRAARGSGAIENDRQEMYVLSLGADRK
jgi:ADP-ribosyl-[dinitrogen reductase] hydrolase